MGRFYCDYCHCYLTHDSASVRKAHNLGRNHIQLVKEYYQKLGYEKTQFVIDSIQQDYQSAIVPTDSNPFAAGIGGRSGYTSLGGMTFGGPLPGMPLGPPPGMPLPGGGVAPGGPGSRPVDTNPFAAALGQLQIPAGIAPSGGGRIEGEGN